MGVPGLWKWAQRAYPEAVREIGSPSRLKGKYGRMYVDVNHILYQATRRSGERGRFGGNLFWRLDAMATDIAPSEGIFLSLDGVAPIGKLTEQRARRASRLGRGARIGEGGVHELALTAGTGEMADISLALMRWCCEKLNSSMSGLREATLSGAARPGEGEFKILQAVLAAKNERPSLVVGTDADLLGMGFLSGVYPDVLKLEDHGAVLFDAQGFAAALHARLPSAEMAETTRDFGFLLQLLGNDFLPRFRGLSLPILLDTYVQMAKVTNSNLVSQTSTGDWSINIPFMVELVARSRGYIGPLQLSRERQSPEVVHDYLRRMLWSLDYGVGNLRPMGPWSGACPSLASLASMGESALKSAADATAAEASEGGTPWVYEFPVVYALALLPRAVYPRYISASLLEALGQKFALESFDARFRSDPRPLVQELNAFFREYVAQRGIETDPHALTYRPAIQFIRGVPASAPAASASPLRVAFPRRFYVPSAAITTPVYARLEQPVSGNFSHLALQIRYGGLRYVDIQASTLPVKDVNYSRNPSFSRTKSGSSGQRERQGKFYSKK